MSYVSRTPEQSSPSVSGSLYRDGVPTLSELITRVRADTNVPTSRRANVASSLRCLAGALGKSIENVHAYPPTLRPLMKDLHPAQLGISQKRWQNVRADVTFALRYAAGARSGTSRGQPLSPSWNQLLEALPNWGRRASMSRFARWCSSRDIEPGQVSDATMSAYLEALTNGTLAARPEVNVYMTARVWNRAAVSIPGWPPIQLSTPNRRKPLVMPEAELPSEFREDLDHWCQRLAGADILANDAIDKPMRPASIQSCRYNARYLHGALVASGRDASEITSLADLVQPSALRAALQHCLDRANGPNVVQTPTVHIGKLAATARQIAKHWVPLGADELLAIHAMTRKLMARQIGMTALNRKRLLQMDDEENRQALLDFPHQEMDRAVKNDDGTRRSSLQAQIAVAVEILLMAPIRMSNLSSLALNQTYFRSVRNGSVKAHLLFEPEQVKNSRSIKIHLPEETVRLIDLYLCRFHGRIARNSPYLFPGHDGKKNSGQLSTQISARLFKVLGLRIHPHLFRHIAAKFYLDEHPGAFEFVRQLLGHKNIATTMNFYAQFSRTAAVLRYDEFVMGLRTGGKRGTA